MTPSELALLTKAARLNPEALLSLSEEQQYAAAMALVAEKDAVWSQDAYKWATEAVSTIDEASSSILPFPDKAYLADLFDAMEHEKRLAVVKSRRMTITWAVAAKLLHKVRYKRHVAGFIQSETETKSAFVIDKRMKFIEDNLLPLYRRRYDSIRGVSGMVTKMSYDTGSYAWGIAQGADVFRTYTPTFIFMDEIEFMEQGHQSFVAALPFIEKDCQIVLVSTSNGPHGVLADMARSAGFVRFKAA